MKNLFIILVTLTLFALFSASSCSRSLNDDDIYSIFFDEMSNVDELNKLHDYSYQFSDRVSHYYEDFNKPNSTNWGVGVSEYFNREIRNGHYVVKSYKDHISGIKLNYDQTKDFQIEMTMTNISWGGMRSKDFAGLLFDITEGVYSGTSLIIRRVYSEDQVAVLDVTNNKDLFQTSNFTINTPVIFTIRKIKGNVSYFINKIFIYKTNYNHSKTNIGYIISRGNTIALDSVQIDYLE